VTITVSAGQNSWHWNKALYHGSAASIPNMRLLNSHTLKFESFADDRRVPKYAVLSHTWDNSEVEYQEVLSSAENLKTDPRFEKIRRCAQQAVQDGLDYFWADTCCIDKSSSAELSEAINSMFVWYRKAAVCYAHLEDFSMPLPAEWKDHAHDTTGWAEAFVNCRWFTRGWTLQELIAPRHLVFYTAEWDRLMTKRQLCQTISRYTGISAPVLLGADFRRERVAERMRWASKRSTTRVEDMAYCLMGLFDVNMPLLYGEGERAFIRLQQEIIKTENDRTLFCWSARTPSSTSFRTLLANSPAEFEEFEDCTIASSYGMFEITQRGLEIAMPLHPLNDNESEVHAIVVEDGPTWLVIRLRRLSGNIFLRVDPHEMIRIWDDKYDFFDKPDKKEPTVIVVPQNFEQYRFDAYMNYRIGGLFLEYLPTELEVAEVQPENLWDGDNQIISIDFSKDFSPLEKGMHMTLCRVENPSERWELDIIDDLRSPGSMRSLSVGTSECAYMTRYTQGFLGDKMVIILNISYMIKIEGEPTRLFFFNSPITFPL
jgi:hypothetical protein